MQERQFSALLKILDGEQQIALAARHMESKQMKESLVTPEQAGAYENRA